ncbi:hypothetical protein VUR80DRAFT_4641 [Thermomyces stellatus]
MPGVGTATADINQIHNHVHEHHRVCLSPAATVFRAGPLNPCSQGEARRIHQHRMDKRPRAIHGEWYNPGAIRVQPPRPDIGNRPPVAPGKASKNNLTIAVILNNRYLSSARETWNRA